MIKGYKGFNQDMTCRGFQYKVGKTYKTDKAVICEAGFHFCENPLDIFSYYEPSKAVFCEVEGFGETVTHDQDSKVCCTEIKVIASLSIKGFVAATVKFFSEKKDKGAKRASGDSSMASNSGDRSMASNSGYRSMASNSGYRSMASNFGDRSMASNSGDRSMASNFGDSSMASNSGYSSMASNFGDRSMASNSGDSSMASNFGDSSMVSNFGDRSMASNSGDSSMASNFGYRSMASNSGGSSMASNSGYSGVAVCTGLSSKAMAGKHGCIALAWWNDKDQRVEMVCAEIGCGDGTDGKLKADVWYMVDESRNIVECKE